MAAPVISGVCLSGRTITSDDGGYASPGRRWFYGNGTLISGESGATLVADLTAERLGVYMDVNAGGGWERSNGLKVLHPSQMTGFRAMWDARDTSTIATTGSNVDSWTTSHSSGAAVVASHLAGTVQPTLTGGRVRALSPGGGADDGCCLRAASRFGMDGNPDLAVAVVGSVHTTPAEGDDARAWILGDGFAAGALAGGIGGTSAALHDAAGGYQQYPTGSLVGADHVFTWWHTDNANFGTSGFDFDASAVTRTFNVGPTINPSNTTTRFDIGVPSGAGVDLVSTFDYGALIVCEASSQSVRDQLSAWVAWAFGLESNLPGGHPYLAAPAADTLTPPSVATPAADNAIRIAFFGDSTMANARWPQFESGTPHSNPLAHLARGLAALGHPTGWESCIGAGSANHTATGYLQYDLSGGGWTTTALETSVGGGLFVSSAASNLLAFHFNESDSFALAFACNSSGGDVRYRLDGGAWESTTTYSVTQKVLRIVLPQAGSVGAHTIEVERLTGTVQVAWCEAWAQTDEIVLLKGSVGDLRAAQAVAGSEPWAFSYAPLPWDYVLLAIGGNDYLDGDPEASVTADVNTLVSRLQALNPSGDILLNEYYDIQPGLSWIPTMFANVAATNSLQLVDWKDQAPFSSWATANSAGYFADAVHTTDSGTDLLWFQYMPAQVEAFIGLATPSVTVDGAASTGTGAAGTWQGLVSVDGSATTASDAAGSGALGSITTDGAATTWTDATGSAGTGATAVDGAALTGSSATGSSGTHAVASDGAASTATAAAGSAGTGQVAVDGAAVTGTDAAGSASATSVTVDGAATTGTDAAGSAQGGAAIADGAASTGSTASGSATVSIAVDGAAATGSVAQGSVGLGATDVDGAAAIGTSAAGSAALGAVTVDGAASTGTNATGGMQVPASTADGAAATGSTAAGSAAIGAVTVDGAASTGTSAVGGSASVTVSGSASTGTRSAGAAQVVGSRIATLIDKRDNVEIVRDEIASILAIESVQQQVLAAAAGKSPRLWALQVYYERTDCWQVWMDSFASQADAPMVVNVWFDEESFEGDASDTFHQQKAVGYFHVDCYGYGLSGTDGGTGQIPGDRQAALESQRVARLVRNILMSAPYNQLGLKGIVWQRWPSALKTMRVQANESGTNVAMTRLTMRVTYHENAPQVVPDTLQTIGLTVNRASDGRVYMQAQYPS